MVEIRNFWKSYGDFAAVKDFSLDIEEGDIYGFIGPNGAGKTTTIRFLSTLLEPTSGSATICGLDVLRKPLEVRRIIGYMPDMFGVYEGMRVWEYLDFFAALYGIKRASREAVINDVIQLLDLEKKRETFVEALSRGMQQRLCLAKTLLHDPKVLILDEPASGLDPRARVFIKELLKALQEMGKTIFISSHILSELADCCNKVAIIEQGTLVAAGDVRGILEQFRETLKLEIEILSEPGPCEDVLARIPEVSSIEVHGKLFKVDFTGELPHISTILKKLVEAGVEVLWFREVPPDLEDVFMQVTKGEVA
ncbi:MAG: ABC transporter ATP-binding protein [Candidatus Omnitrophica bacterium]|nr:ABC transporter ATP-binding protein [Candidatus Omnitrophota bacterium]